MRGVVIDESTYVHSNTVIGRNVKIGPNCSIGYEGFEFSRDEMDIPRFVEHRGRVVIEDNVEIQANVAIDRGLREDDDTVIGKDSKVDNLVHIAHSCKIGQGNLIVAGTVFGGSMVVGKNNFFGAGCVIKPGCRIGDGNLIGMGAVVVGDISNYEVWVGNPARKLRHNLWWMKRKRKEN